MNSCFGRVGKSFIIRIRCSFETITMTVNEQTNEEGSNQTMHSNPEYYSSSWSKDVRDTKESIVSNVVQSRDAQIAYSRLEDHCFIVTAVTIESESPPPEEQVMMDDDIVQEHMNPNYDNYRHPEMVGGSIGTAFMSRQARYRRVFVNNVKSLHSWMCIFGSVFGLVLVIIAYGKITNEI